MGGRGSDAAIETADVVLMTDSPIKMVEAVKIARQSRKIVWQNIVVALLVKLVFVTLGAMGMASMWEAVFADMGVSLAAVLNSTRVLQGKGIRLGSGRFRRERLL
jgi:Cd2+/Zn2+-exporting ATPase